MKYVYKEPETWDELFDALAAVHPDLRVCSDVRAVVVELNPPNLSAFLTASGDQQADYEWLWIQIVDWWQDAYWIVLNKRIEALSSRRLDRYPTKRDIAALRKFLRSLLVKAHTLYGSQQ